MDLLLLVPALLHLMKLHVVSFVLNHLVNIPLTLLFGVGKYVAFGIAFIMDIVQLTIYYNVLNNTGMGRRLSWAIDKKFYQEYKEPEFISHFHNKWQYYYAVLFLAMLPVYFGGLLVAMFTAHALKLKKARSLVFICIGSLIGCFIWTIGVWNLIEYLTMLFRK
jgi:uncharacterized membrane protein